MSSTWLQALAMGAKAVIPTSDAEAMKAAAATLNGIIDTVSAPHDLNALLELLEPRGKLVMVGLPPGKVELDHFPIVTRYGQSQYNQQCFYGHVGCCKLSRVTPKRGRLLKAFVVQCAGGAGGYSHYAG